MKSQKKYKNDWLQDRKNTCSEKLEWQDQHNGEFEQLINSMRQQDDDDYDMEIIFDVYVSFIDRWMKRPNSNWKYDLYCLYTKQSLQKQNEIIECLNLYIKMSNKPTVVEKIMLRYCPYVSLKNYFEVDYFDEYIDRLRKEVREIEKERQKKARNAKKKQTLLAKTLLKTGNIFLQQVKFQIKNCSIWQYVALKWHKKQNKDKKNQYFEPLLSRDQDD